MTETINKNEVTNNTYWYILWVKTRFENEVIRDIENYFDKDIIYPFVLLEELIFINKKIQKQVIRPIFPGYVFIDSILESNKFTENITKFIHKNEKVLKILNYGDPSEIVMREEERKPFLTLCNDNNCIEISKGFKTGGKIYITEGPLFGKEGIIKKINRHKRIAVIEMVIMGQVVTVKVGLEVVEKI